MTEEKEVGALGDPAPTTSVTAYAVKVAALYTFF